MQEFPGVGGGLQQADPFTLIAPPPANCDTNPVEKKNKKPPKHER